MCKAFHKLRAINNSIVYNRRSCCRHLQRGSTNKTLTYRRVSIITGEPLLVEILLLPLWARHSTGIFTRQINPGLLTYTEGIGVFFQAVDPQFRTDLIIDRVT